MDVQSGDGPLVRAARPEDGPALRKLDPGSSASRIGWAEVVDSAWVIEVGGRPVAFLGFERPHSSHVYLTRLVVHPEHRDRDLENLLIRHVLAHVSGRDLVDRPAFSMSVDVEDTAVLQALFGNGFVARRTLENLHGSGRNGLYCLYKSRVEYLDPDERYLFPITSWDPIRTLLAEEKYAVTGAYQLAGRRVLEVARFEDDDLATLQSDESAAGISFAAGILAAITFVLGFSFTSTRYPDDIKVLLLGSALATTLALIIYANTSGELARLRTNVFVYHMKWGNVLSEYGGVLPFMVSLEVTYARTTNSVVAAFVTAVICSVVLALYDRSDFSLSGRFSRSVGTKLLSALIIAAPTVGALVIRVAPFSWPWTAAFAGVLIAQGSVYLFWRQGEAGVRDVGRRWQVRN